MFGYVRTYTSELYVKENEFYKGVYCGLCRSLGKCTGQLSRATLNYDFVFGALLRMAATGEKIGFEKKRCIIHPIRKRAMVNLLISARAPELCFRITRQTTTYVTKEAQRGQRRDF